MKTTILNGLKSSVAVATAVILAACAENVPVAPGGVPWIPPTVSAAREPALGTCAKLAPPQGSKLALRVYASGVQIYRWTGTSWGFVAPDAMLSADAAGKSVVGTHYAGPIWESNSGGKVAGTVIDRCTPNPNAIAWLSLAGVAEGNGIFHRVVFIQRVNTAGGKEPATPGTFAGQEARVPYTTEYYFYR
jgi:hypothetical protein